MARFSKSSAERLSSCHSDLQIIFNEIIRYFDCVVICGHRNKDAQDKAYSNGNSTLKYPKSKHNALPSIAVDVAPYDREKKIDWDDIKRFYFFAGQVMATARYLQQMGKLSTDYKGLRFGGDWDGDTELKDNSFNDLVHYELMT